ncbi:unnamed protein product [Owenia fusiformis]|uniref:VWFA domain-containing protein n=1 Tax=Owenia fusiformis TaxID=6347 RepID=A0A8S4QAE4_OWEFU|nr:unnamed protein product [Owenia fusiformis]
MLSLALYILAVLVGLILIWFFDPHEKEKNDTDFVEGRANRKARHDYRQSSIFAVLGLSREEILHFTAFRDHFHSFEEVIGACKRAGLEKSHLIIGVDFTASNEWQGRKTFSGNCLHKISGSRISNPYQKVISILGQTISAFDDDSLIPAYGFGDVMTQDQDVFPFKPDSSSCQDFHEVLEYYNDIARTVTLGGPTNFAPLIYRAMDIVRDTEEYHILVIIADGQVTEEDHTIQAIVKASLCALSIIVVGVGDGPWEIMEEFDDRLPRRKFDNFQFIDYHKITHKAKNPETALALHAMMEIPDQYKAIKQLGYLQNLRENTDLVH